MLDEMIKGLDRIGALITGEERPFDELPETWTIGDAIGSDEIHRVEVPGILRGDSPSEAWLPDPESFDGIETGDLGAQVKQYGFHRLAWYRSFRNQDPFDRYPWGLYVTMRGVALLAHRIRLHEGGAEPGQYNLKRAFDALYWHEFHHFKTDLAIGTCELVTDQPIFKLRPGFGSDRYMLDEALCNAYALDKADAPAAWLAAFNRDQPAGYRDGPAWKGKRPLAYPRLVMLYQDRLQSPPVGVEGIFSAQHRSVWTTDVPLWIVAPPGSSGLFRLVTSINQLVETPRFKKDMQNLPPTIREKKWPRTKAKLAAPFADPGLQFKKLKGSPNLFRARVDRNYRVILRPRAQDSAWELLRIGSHAELDRYRETA